MDELVALLNINDFCKLKYSLPKILSEAPLNQRIFLLKFFSVVSISCVPLIGLLFGGYAVVFIFLLSLIIEAFYGTKRTNLNFVFMSIIYSRLFLFPFIETGEVKIFYIDYLYAIPTLHQEPVTFLYLNILNMFFDSPEAAVKFFRISTALIVASLLYALINKLNLSRVTVFITTFFFMFWHIQIISFEADQFKNFLAQVWFLLFLLSLINRNKLAYLYMAILPLTHLSYSIVAFIILVFHKKILNNKINYYKMVVFIILVFSSLLAIVPYLNIDFMRISARVGEYMIYSKHLFSNQLAEKGGILYMEVISTSAIWIYIMLYLFYRDRSAFDNVAFRFIFVSWLIPFVISKMYLLGHPFLVDRFIMLHHGFMIVSLIVALSTVVDRGIKLKPGLLIFYIFLGYVTLHLLFRDHYPLLMLLINPDVKIFDLMPKVLIYSYAFATVLLFFTSTKVKHAYSN